MAILVASFFVVLISILVLSVLNRKRMAEFRKGLKFGDSVYFMYLDHMAIGTIKGRRNKTVLNKTKQMAVIDAGGPSAVEVPLELIYPIKNK